MQKHSFENFIIQCCKSKEWDLRAFLKRKLKQAGFTVQEDSYLSRRVNQNSKYKTVHNLLAIRGEPKVCLVAHTDVCRDHGFTGRQQAPDVFPVIKYVEKLGDTRAIIQDKDCNYQTGGDDRLGVAINTWIALNTGYDLALLFTTDEEVGLISANRVRFSELNTYELLVQVDRGNNTRQLVTNISGTKLCSSTTADKLLKIAREMGIPRSEVRGLMTDVEAIISNGVAKEAVNMTCGYHNSFGESSNEYIDVQEAKDTLKYVSEIIKYYDLSEYQEEDNQHEVIDGIFEDLDEDVDLGSLKLEEMTIKQYIDFLNVPKHKKSKEEEIEYIENISELFDDDAMKNLNKRLGY